MSIKATQPEPTDEDMVNAAYRLHKYRQGTDNGIAFNRGARWMRDALATPSPQPAEAVPDGVWEALQRMIEDGLLKGPASQEDARAVSRYRDRVRFLATPQPAEAKTAAVDGMTAWRDYAQHLEWCATCAQDSVGSCHEGTALKEAAAIATQEGGHD